MLKTEIQEVYEIARQVAKEEIAKALKAKVEELQETVAVAETEVKKNAKL